METLLNCFVFTPILVSLALGRLPHQFKPDRTCRGVWKSHTHQVLLLQRNSGHFFFYWWERRHAYGPGTVPCACLGNDLSVHCPRSEVNRKGKRAVNIGSMKANRISSLNSETFKTCWNMYSMLAQAHTHMPCTHTCKQMADAAASCVESLVSHSETTDLLFHSSPTVFSPAHVHICLFFILGCSWLDQRNFWAV